MWSPRAQNDRAFENLSYLKVRAGYGTSAWLHNH